jgi:aminopeptidase N
MCALLAATIQLARGEFEVLVEHCSKTATFLAPSTAANGRQYAPDWDVRPLHIALDVTPDFKKRSIQAVATLRFAANVVPTRQVRLDCIGLRIASVESSEEIQAYQVTEDALEITFAEDMAPEHEVTLTISYSAEPEKGLYFRTPEMGYREGDTHLFSQGESILSRHWYPSFDAPNVLLTSEITCRVPQGMTVISNGRLVSESKDENSGLTAFHWTQEKRHANYLLTLVAGYFQKVEDRYRDIPLAFYTPPSEIEQATNSFRGTREMMEFFEQEIGVAYPWQKYDQVCVNDFVAGGMENTSATTLTDGTLFSSATENLDNSQGLVAHELAHQWFGDLVTCKDWSQLWLNEGFATYYEILWTGRNEGRDAMLLDLWRNLRMITGAGGTPQPIVRRTYSEPDDMFGYLAYQKGGWVLHMLRSQLGEQRYRRAIQLFLERHRHQNVVTEDLRRIIEEVSGRSYDQFFDQWVYHAHHPELDVSYRWDEAAKVARLTVRQTQKIDTNVLLFKVPLTVRFKGSFGTRDETLQISQAEEDFAVALESAPRLVRMDPDCNLLAKVSFAPPESMLEEQLLQMDDPIGRIVAVERLGQRRSAQTPEKLRKLLNDDPFYAVRIEASRALRALHTDEALDALLASTDQPDARVRRQVTDDIGSFYNERAFGFATKAMDREQNPEIRSVILRDLAGYAKPEVHDLLVEQLDTDSYRDQLIAAAVAGLRSQDDPAGIAPLLTMLKRRQNDLRGSVLGQGLSALAYLARNEEDKGTVREFLMQHLNSHKRAVKVAAINGLGTLGDPKAIGALEKFASAGPNEPGKAAASSAVSALRSARRPVDDFKNLRQEVLDLKKSDSELRKELETLRKEMKDKPSHPAAGTQVNGSPAPEPPRKRGLRALGSPKAEDK